MEQMLIGLPLGSKIIIFFSNLKKSYRGLALLWNEVKNWKQTNRKTQLITNLPMILGQVKNQIFILRNETFLLFKRISLGLFSVL